MVTSAIPSTADISPITDHRSPITITDPITDHHLPMSECGAISIHQFIAIGATSYELSGTCKILYRMHHRYSRQCLFSCKMFQIESFVLRFGG